MPSRRLSQSFATFLSCLSFSILLAWPSSSLVGPLRLSSILFFFCLALLFPLQSLSFSVRGFLFNSPLLTLRLPRRWFYRPFVSALFFLVFSALSSWCLVRFTLTRLFRMCCPGLDPFSLGGNHYFAPSMSPYHWVLQCLQFFLCFNEPSPSSPTFPPTVATGGQSSLSAYLLSFSFHPRCYRSRSPLTYRLV